MEMDAILAVALGGTLLSGGKFFIGGSVIGAITIQTLTTTMYALGVSADQLPVVKAICCCGHLSHSVQEGTKSSILGKAILLRIEFE